MPFDEDADPYQVLVGARGDWVIWDIQAGREGFRPPLIDELRRERISARYLGEGVLRGVEAEAMLAALRRLGLRFTLASDLRLFPEKSPEE